MGQEHHGQVLERLLELEGWADYIMEALHRDRKSEPVKMEMLQQILGEQALRQIRELSWSLRERLHLVTTQLDLSRPAPAGDARNIDGKEILLPMYLDAGERGFR
jgi:hypothetical protein